jgi:tyrosine decarboxylase/aspartate 1-decarboxylase
MQLYEKGLPEKAILNELESKLKEDFSYDVGRIMDSMCTSPHEFAKQVYMNACMGVVDPIPGLSEIALANDVYFHVDAAFGGFVLPFLKELGLNFADFDFRLSGVCSITVDPHKMGLAPISAGGILFKEEEMMRSIGTRVPYLAGGGTEHTTILGTRSGASAIAVWSLLMHLGRQGYRGVVGRCMRLMSKLVEGIRRIDGINLVTEPTMNMVGISSNEIDIKSVAKEVRRRGWAVSLFPNHIRVVVMPHIKSSHIEYFLKDLKATVETLER